MIGRDNQGLMYLNEGKRNSKHPDLRGKLTVNGANVEISGWWKDGRDGKRFLSLSTREARDKTSESE